MTKSRWRLTARLAPVVMLAGVSFSALAAPKVQFGLNHVFKLVVTENVAQTLPAATPAGQFVNLPGAGPDGSAFAFVGGQASLINVRFTAESVCGGGTAGQGAWCSVRILINGVEADPVHGTDYAFDSNNNGADTGSSWEGHAMERHLCIRNPTGGTNFVPVQVQWAVVNVGAVAPSFRLDDWSLSIETALTNSCP